MVALVSAAQRKEPLLEAPVWQFPQNTMSFEIAMAAIGFDL